MFHILFSFKIFLKNIFRNHFPSRLFYIPILKNQYLFSILKLSVLCYFLYFIVILEVHFAIFFCTVSKFLCNLKIVSSELFWNHEWLVHVSTIRKKLGAQKLRLVINTKHKYEIQRFRQVCCILKLCWCLEASHWRKILLYNIFIELTYDDMTNC